MNKLFKTILPLILSIIIFVSPLTIVCYSSSTPSMGGEAWASKVDPVLLDESFYTKPLFEKLGIERNLVNVKEVELPGRLVTRIRSGQAKVIIIASPLADINDIEKHTKGIIFGFKLNKFWYIEAWITRDDLEALARNNHVYRIIAAQSPISSIFKERSLVKNGYRTEVRAEPSLHAAVDVIGASKVWEEYNITGKDVKVAIVDTGVDYGINDLGLDALARDENGLPLIFDSDEMGLVLTLTTVVKDPAGYIIIDEPVTYFDWSPVLSYYEPIIGETTQGWVLIIPPTGEPFVAEFPLSRFYVGDIHSRDNVFKFGLAVQTLYPGYGLYGVIQYTVPVLLADTNDDGAYDTVYADLSTVYYLIAVGLNATGMASLPANPDWYDLSFAGEPAATIGSEVIGRDFTGDGVNDFNLGTIAGYVYDWLGVLTGYSEYLGWTGAWEYGASILPGMDPGGNYVVIAYDWYGHGTSCASVVASRGKTTYDLGYGEFKLKGIAPEAKLASAPGDLINALTAEFFFAGFDPVNEPWNWTFTGSHKVDVISNSWGLSYIGYIGFISGIDPLSLLEDYIVASSGTVIVHAMGNGGPGYGTATIPASGSLVISVGASTLFEYRQLYGYLPGAWGEVVSWSDRGPTDIGTVKPDVVNIGSFAWAPAPWHFGLGDGSQAFDLFSGTSEATPMTSGSVALIIQAYKEKYGDKPAPGFVKTLLKSAAKDLGYDPFTQGSGHVDVYTAVKALYEGGVPRVYSLEVFNEIKEFIDVNEETLGIELTPVEDTQIYTGPLYPGDEVSYTLYIEGEEEYEIKAFRYTTTRESLIEYLDLDNAIAYTPEGAKPLRDFIVDVKDNTLYLNISYPSIDHILIPVSEDAYKDSELVVFIASYPYNVFDATGRKGIYGYVPGLPWFYAGTELHYWFDLDDDAIMDLEETARMNYDIRMANNFHVPLGKPLEKIELLTKKIDEYVGGLPASMLKSLVLDFRVYFNAYYYEQGYVILPLRLEIVKAERVEWNWIDVPETGSGEVSVTVKVPEDAVPGVYQGYIVVKGGIKDVLVPVSIVVKAGIDENTMRIRLKGGLENRLFENYYIEGQFDWSWRYESGDWRIFPVEITDPDVVGVIVSVHWEGRDTNIDVIIGGKGSPYLLAGSPDTSYYTSVIAAKLTEFLYGSGWGTHFDSPAPKMAVIYAPVEGPGTYWIVIRNTLIDANEYYPEPFKINIIPIRASSREITIDLENGTGSAELTIYGSYALSNAKLFIVSVSGDATVTVSSKLGVGNRHTIVINASATTESIVKLGIMLEGYRQYTIGLTYNGVRFVSEYPAIIWFTIHIIP